MDIILKIYDEYILTPFIYPKYWNENDISRQFLSLIIIVSTHSILLYLAISGSVLINIQVLMQRKKKNEVDYKKIGLFQLI